MPKLFISPSDICVVESDFTYKNEQKQQTHINKTYNNLYFLKFNKQNLSTDRYIYTQNIVSGAEEMELHDEIPNGYLQCYPSNIWLLTSIKYQVIRAPDKGLSKIIQRQFLLLLNENICCDHSLEPSR